MQKQKLVKLAKSKSAAATAGCDRVGDDDDDDADEGFVSNTRTLFTAVLRRLRQLMSKMRASIAREWARKGKSVDWELLERMEQHQKAVATAIAAQTEGGEDYYVLYCTMLTVLLRCSIVYLPTATAVINIFCLYCCVVL